MKARPPRRLPIALVALLAAALLVPPAASADDPVGPVSYRPPSQTTPPPGFRLSAVEARRIAAGTRAARRLRATHAPLSANVTIPGYDSWEIDYYRVSRTRTEIAYHEMLEVDVRDSTGRVTGVWTGRQLTDLLARGHIGGHADNAWIWIVLSVAFVAPFFDLRRPLRLLHLDLLAVVSLTISYALFTASHVELSVPLVYPPLVYLVARMLSLGFRPRPGREPLVPHLPTRVLAVGLLLLIGLRVGIDVVNATKVLDVGYAGVVGAHRIVHGLTLYSTSVVNHGDTYGPFNYVAYIPFEAIFPYHGRWDSLPAAHAAAITFDLLTLGGLFALGVRVRRGAAGRRLGVALAFAWAACPFTMLTLATNVNDALISMLLVFALIALSSAPVRGVLIGLAAAAKFAPLALMPLFARGRGGRGSREVLMAAAAAVAIPALAVLAYLPHGGLAQVWDRTVGFQMTRPTSFSLWAQHPWLHPLQLALEVAIAALALTLGARPRRRDLAQVAALGAAVLIGIELSARHWFYFYVAWFLPFVLAALFLRHATDAPRHEPDELEAPVLAGTPTVVNARR